MMTSIVAASIYGLIISQGSMDAAQFEAVIKTIHERVKDVTLIYEGTSHFIGPASSLKLGHRPFHESFQGFYTHRDDGATWIDLYHYFESNATSYNHDTRVALNGEELGLSRAPDTGRTPTQPKVSLRYPGCLNDEDAPECMLYLWLFQDIKNYAKFGFKFLGREKIDGHICLKVQLNISPRPLEASHPYHVYWIDMERGGHPLQIERYVGDKFMYRTKVELSQIPFSDSETLWFPRFAEIKGYFWEGVSHPEPVFLSTYTIVRGSTVFNQGLKDSYFSIFHTSDDFPASIQSNALRGFERAKREPLARVDPRGVKIRLDEARKRADQQADELSAKPSPPSFSESTTLIQVLLTAIAALMLVAVVIVKRRA